MRLTKQRLDIINIFKAKNDKLLNKEDLLVCAKNMNIHRTTLYRNLELLLQANILTRIFIDSTSYYCLKSSHREHYIICTQCFVFVTIPCRLNRGIYANSAGYRISHHDVISYGLCPKCILNPRR